MNAGKGESQMTDLTIYKNDFYIITEDFRLLDFNQNVKDRYKGIKVGDFCYKAKMNRDTPCLHCPIAGNTKQDCPIYFDPFYEDWVEALFSSLGGGRYAVTCRTVQENDQHMFNRLKDDDYCIANNVLDASDSELLGMIGGYCEEGFPLYYVNDCMVRMLGYDSREEFEERISGRVINTIHPDDLGQVIADIGENYYVGMKYETSYRMPRKDGTWFWTIDRGEVIEASDGRLAIISVCMDITERLNMLDRIGNANKKLMVSNQYWMSTFEHMPGGYYRVKAEKDYPFIYISDRFEKLLGYAKNEIKEIFHNKLSELLLDDEDKKTLEFTRSVLLGTDNREISKVLKVQGKDRVLWMDCSMVFVDLGIESFIHGTMTDITSSVEEREKARIAADNANKAKSDFLFNMSHDIRTPMNAIVGYTDLLEKNIEDSRKSKEYIAKIRKVEAVLLSLINNVLEMSRIESGKAVMDEEAGSLTELFNNYYTVFEGQLQEKKIEFSSEIRVEHDYLYFDETKMRQIFINILSNSFKYTHSGGKVSVCVQELPSESRETALIRTEIKDTGIGMSQDFLPYIFDKFSRAHTSTDSRVEGTGLGMPIVKKLIDLMGGTITVESELGKGTAFTVTISHRIAETRKSCGYDNVSDYTSAFCGKRILLAEDNDLNAEIALEILSEVGFSVERAKDGIECLYMLEHSDNGYYDLVLMDIQMPNMDGYKATQFIRSLDDQGKASIPIIAMTANAFKEDRDRAIAFGMNGHVAKPIDIAALFSMLNEILQTNR